MSEVALITSVNGDGLATVVDILTGMNVASLKNSSALTGGTALIAGDFVVSAQAKGTALHFWAWGTEQPRLKCHSPEKLGPLAVSCDGSLCAGGGISGRVYLWEVSSGTLLRAWDAHYKAASALTFSPDGCFLYSGGEDAMLSSWNMLDAADPDESDSFKGGGNHSLSAMWTASEHSLPITSVHAAVGGGRVYTSSLDRSAKAWDACSGRLLLSVTCPAFLRAVTTDPAEAFLFAGGGGGVIFQVDISATAIAATASNAALGSSGAFSFEGLSESEARDSSWGLRIDGDSNAGMGVGGGGSSLSSGDGGGSGRRQELHGHEKAITCLSVSSDSSVLVSGSEDGTVRTWHVASRQCIQKIDAPGKGGVSQVVLLPMPEDLVRGRGSGSGGGRRKQPVPLAPFDKFIRSSAKNNLVTSAGLDFAAGCTPVILRGVPCPRGRLGLENGVGVKSGFDMKGPGGGIRAALEALQGRGGVVPDSGVEGGEQGRGRERGIETQRAEKVAKLEIEIERLRDENRRWQEVNNTLYQKLGAATAGKA